MGFIVEIGYMNEMKCCNFSFRVYLVVIGESFCEVF